ncbi:MAG TPA: bifunctional phosphoglucose/phosphomannose isomerase [Dehalococcoidia bacterium]|nr:bifunctional phosphoglucose/phosphomannose isomerase [Dehalococcoidia bacterium]
MTELDDSHLRLRLDKEGSYERNRDFPQQLRDAWNAARDFSLPEAYAHPRGLVVAGMGGSAIAGDYMQALAFHAADVPIAVIRGYDLPAWVVAGVTVIACSHSGNTEETLSVFAKARERGANVIAVTTGGRLLRDASAAGLPVFAYEFPGEPRSAFGHGLMRLLGIGRAVAKLQLGSAPDDSSIVAAIDEVASMRVSLSEETPEAENPAKQLARRLHGRLALFIGGDFLWPAAKRWKTQVNENADSFAMADELPELHHNTVVGLGLPPDIASRIRGVILQHAGLSPRMKARCDVTAEVLDRANLAYERLDAGGTTPLAGLLRDAYLQNMTTYYLGLLNGVDPFAVTNIDFLKQRLSEM